MDNLTAKKMPPRMVKRGSAAAGTKRTTRVTRGTPKAQSQAQAEAPDDVPVVEAKEDLKVEEVKGRPIVAENPVVEEKPTVIDQPVLSEIEDDANPELNGLKSKFLLLICHSCMFCMILCMLSGSCCLNIFVCNVVVN